jgi:hypothetical protein
VRVSQFAAASQVSPNVVEVANAPGKFDMLSVGHARVAKDKDAVLFPINL